MKILILSQYFYPENFRINEVAHSLSLQEGISVDVLTGKPNYPHGIIFPGYSFFRGGHQKLDDINIFRVPLIPRGSGGALRIFLNYISFILFASIYAPFILRGKRYDLIYVYAPSPILQVLPALFIRKFKNVKIILNIQDLWPESFIAMSGIKNKFCIYLIEVLVKYVYRKCDLLLIQSEAYLDPVRAIAGATPIKYHPNSANFTSFSHAKFDYSLPDNISNGFSLLFAGNVGKAQAVKTIFEAALILKDYPSIHFLFAGNGSRLQWLKDQAKMADLKNIHFIGTFSSSEMPHLMSKVSALLVTLEDKPIYSKTIPSKIQSYLAAGKPIIGSLNGEGAKILRDSRSGLVVPAENPRNLVKAIIEISELTDLESLALGNNASTYFNIHFNHDKLIRELTSIFRDVINVEDVSGKINVRSR